MSAIEKLVICIQIFSRQSGPLHKSLCRWYFSVAQLSFLPGCVWVRKPPQCSRLPYPYFSVPIRSHPFFIRSSTCSGGTVKHTGNIIIGQVMHQPFTLPEIKPDPADEPLEPIWAVRLIAGGGEKENGLKTDACNATQAKEQRNNLHCRTFFM